MRGRAHTDATQDTALRAACVQSDVLEGVGLAQGSLESHTTEYRGSIDALRRSTCRGTMRRWRRGIEWEKMVRMDRWALGSLHVFLESIWESIVHGSARRNIHPRCMLLAGDRRTRSGSHRMRDGEGSGNVDGRAGKGEQSGGRDQKGGGRQVKDNAEGMMPAALWSVILVVDLHSLTAGREFLSE